MTPIPIPTALLPIVNHLLTLAETEPLVADTVIPIIQKAVDFALTSGEASNPDVWIRAFRAASAEVATHKFDETWLSRLPVERGE